MTHDQQQTVDAHGELARMRRELDQVDAELRESVRSRLAVCEQIGRLKRDHSIPVMQPGRVDSVTEAARDFAQEHGQSPDFYSELYRVIISETCRIQDELMDEVRP